MLAGMRIVCFSDTHGHHQGLTVPPGDVLVFAGDACRGGTLTELAPFAEWMGRLPHRDKLFVAGNHDWPFVREAPEARRTLAANGIGYLQDEAVVIEGITFYGSPWQPEFCGWAFNLPRGDALRDKWSRIPDDTRVLITHSPPFGIRDRLPSGLLVGCEALALRVLALGPDLHVFGHVHDAAGLKVVERTRFANVAVVDEEYRLVRPASVFDIQLPGRTA